MLQEIAFDPQKDFSEVIPDLAMNVAEALITGVVKDTIDTSPYTKETDVQVIGNYVTDNIEVAMALRKMGKSLSSMPTSVNLQTSNGGDA